MFYLQNLSSSTVTKGLPWDFKATEEITETICRDKKARDGWINHPGTKHCVYTFYEGLNANLRVTRPRSDDEGNPPIGSHAIVADLDSAITKEELLRLLKELPFMPNRIERTLSGNWRCIWLFEKILLFPSYDFLLHFLKKFEDFGFRISLAGPGFDRGAFEDPCRMWTNSCEWLDPVENGLRPSPIPESITTGWLVKASQTFNWGGKNMGVAIPLDIVKEAIAKKYPRFVEWPEDFVEGAQGPSFWLEGSRSPKSAIVRPTGMQTFSASATKSFYTWSELLGADFVKQYESESIGGAVKGIYSDGKIYYRKNLAGLLIPCDKDEIRLHLKIDKNVSSKPDKDGKSDVERCLAFISNHQRVFGAGPFVMRPTGIVEVGGKPYLNTLELKPIRPAPERTVWGPSGKMPFLSLYLDHLVTTTEQFERLFSWHKVLYEAVLYSKPQKGLTLILAGGPGVGKTFYLSRVVGAMIGGHADASEFLAGDENFNSAMLASPLLTSDDATNSTSRQAHRFMTEMVKKFTANHRFLHKEKFVKEAMVDWSGWVAITLNDDEESMRGMLDLEGSILDKLLILRVIPVPIVKFPRQDVLNEILERELPYLARALLDWEIPEYLLGDSRYVLKPYCEPSLFKSAQQSSTTAGFQEILEDFLPEYFKVQKVGAKFWEGTAYQLHKAILSDTSAEAAMKPFTVDAVARHLSMLKNKGVHIEVIEGEGASRRWRLFPDTFNNQKTK